MQSYGQISLKGNQEVRQCRVEPKTCHISLIYALEDYLNGHLRLQKSTWFNEECRQAAIEKNDARQDTFLSAATRTACEKYRQKSREERRLFRSKKHEFVKADCEQIEMHGCRYDARNFFQKIKHMSEGFKYGASLCKDQDSNMVTDIKS